MDVIGLLQPSNVALFLLVAVRSMAAMSVGPLAAWPGLPLSARMFVGLGVALALAPVVPTAVPASQLQLGPVQLIQEGAIGLLFGVASTLLVSAVEMAAGLIDFQAGFTFGAAFDPISGHQDGPIERFLTAFAAVLFLDLNGHHLFLLALDELFQIVPVSGTPNLVGPGGVAQFFAAIFVAALAMSLPIVSLLLVADAALAIVSRAAPQFNLLAVGMPAKIGLALIAVAVLLPVTASQLEYLFGRLSSVLPVLVKS